MTTHMPDQNTPRDVTERISAIVTAGTASVAIAAATAAGSTAALATFWAMFPAAVSLGLWAGFEWRKRRAERWWECIVAASPGKTVEEIQGIIEAHSDEPFVRETILESVRRMLESVSDEAVEVLGSITADYIGSNRAPDPFFRGVARLVADLESSEISDLRELLRDLCTVDADQFVVRQLLVDGRLIVRADFAVALDPVGSDEQPSARDGHADFTRPNGYLRLCHGLKVHGLAADEVGGVMNAFSGPHVMVVERVVLRRLSRLFAGALAT